MGTWAAASSFHCVALFSLRSKVRSLEMQSCPFASHVVVRSVYSIILGFFWALPVESLWAHPTGWRPQGQLAWGFFFFFFYLLQHGKSSGPPSSGDMINECKCVTYILHILNWRSCAKVKVKLFHLRCPRTLRNSCVCCALHSRVCSRFWWYLMLLELPFTLVMCALAARACWARFSYVRSLVVSKFNWTLPIPFY